MLDMLLSSRVVTGNVILMSLGLVFRLLIPSELDNSNVFLNYLYFFVCSFSVFVPVPDLSDDGSDIYLPIFL